MLASVALSACSQDDPTTATAQGNVIRMAAVGVGALDPARLDQSNAAWVTAVDLLFDRLTEYDSSTDAAVPDLASSWSTSDLTTWSFTIDPSRKFSDGTPVTAADVTSSLERVASDPASLPGARLDVIEGVAELAARTAPHARGIVASDERTVTITTTGPYGDLPALLSGPGYGIVEAASLDVRSDAPRGSGRYTVGAVEASATTLTSPSLPAVRLVRYDSIDAGAAALAAGEVDWAITPTGSASTATGTHDTSFFKGAVVTLGINVRSRALSDLRVRRAVVAAIDRTAIATAAGDGVATPWSSLVPPVAHSGDCAAPCAADVAAATASLAAVGTPVSLHLDLYDEPLIRLVADEVARELTAVGMTIEVRVHSDAEYSALVASGQQELFLTGEAGLAPSPDPYLSAAYSSSGKANLSQLSDLEVDAALKAARSTADPAQRRLAYRKTEDAVLALAAAVPLVALNTRCQTSAAVADMGSEPGRALVPSRLAFFR